MNMSGVSLCNDKEKYLKLPSYVGKSKYGHFEAIKDKVGDMINNWTNIYLSQASKEVLIKAVA